MFSDDDEKDDEKSTIGFGALPNGPKLNNTLPQRTFCQLVID